MGLDVTSLRVTLSSREGCEVVLGSQKRSMLKDNGVGSLKAVPMLRRFPKCPGYLAPDRLPRPTSRLAWLLFPDEAAQSRSMGTYGQG